MTNSSPSPRLYGFFADDKQTRSVLMTGFFICAVLAVIFPASVIDPRTLNGISIWIKPLKFSIALVVHSFTAAILMQQLSAKLRTGWVMMATTGAYAAALTWETVYIVIQCMRGRESHYNNETALEQILYGLMGLGAFILVVLPIVIGFMVWRQRDTGWTGYRLGTVLGCLLGPLLTIIYGFTMSFGASHFVGAPANASDAGGLPLLGWSTQYADLRPAHFFALHLIQIAPLSGWVMDKIAPTISRLVVIGATLIFAGLSTWLFFNPMAGNPLPL